MLESQIKVLLERLETSPSQWGIPRPFIQRMARLQRMSGLVSEEAIPYIATLTPHYYHKIGSLLKKGFWELDYRSRDFPQDLILWPFREGEALHEEDSDNCLSELFGTGKKSKSKCDISDQCWDMMTRKGYNGYSLSHEIFYLEIGKQFGCLAEMNMKAWYSDQPPLDDLAATFCANMLNEAALIVKEGYRQRRQDLFMEQEYRPDVIHVIKKREERPLEHGCLCHRTTVAIGALSQYVRYIIEYMALQNGHAVTS
ncbi:hypothetical protein FSP39_016471 [Pinctada imbricata]|uniref:Uncharacterized protein n=1 Tax=Pinctada imbricata TaxID=66713 RepID=A0AA88XST5_PINIB|nr:hypothetical protein FSP39_016471 [Pinctada imbricata]